jgi:RNA polymerase sigma-70 factor, ECF subfamily
MRIQAPNALVPWAVLPSSSNSVVPVDDTIEELVARVRRGEPRAFETIVRQHLRSAYVVALAVLQRPTDAEDVAQEALIVALERIDTLRDARQFRSWLLQIVRNQAVNWRSRRRLRDVAREAPADRPHEASPPDALAFRFRLLEAMAVLGPTEREIVLLHDLEGWTHPEIAEALAISVVMSRQHLFQARRKLRTHLDSPNEDVDHE